MSVHWTNLNKVRLFSLYVLTRKSFDREVEKIKAQQREMTRKITNKLLADHEKLNLKYQDLKRNCKHRSKR